MSTKILYAAVGVGDFAIEKARKVQGSLDLSKARQIDLTTLTGHLYLSPKQIADRSSKLYDGLALRGEKTVRSIRNSAPTKRAVAQTKTARTQTKAAVTSVKKAAATTVEATLEAASGN